MTKLHDAYAVSRSDTTDADSFIVMSKMFRTCDEALAEVLRQVNEMRDYRGDDEVESVEDLLEVVDDGTGLFAQVSDEDSDTTWRVHAIDWA